MRLRSVSMTCLLSGSGKPKKGLFKNYSFRTDDVRERDEKDRQRNCSRMVDFYATMKLQVGVSVFRIKQ